MSKTKRKKRRSRVKYLPVAWVWRALLEMRDMDGDPTLIFYTERKFRETLAKLYSHAAPARNETISKKLDVLERLGFITRHSASERRRQARDHFDYPIRLKKDATADLEEIFEVDKSARTPIPRGSLPPPPPSPGTFSPDWIPSGDPRAAPEPPLPLVPPGVFESAEDSGGVESEEEEPDDDDSDEEPEDENDVGDEDEPVSD